MAKLFEATSFTSGPTPQDVKTLRQEVYDYHSSYGQPLVYKHRWNLQDLTQGLCQKCPWEDDAYHRDKTSCPYCFGTGFLGGFADGVIIFATINDTQTDQLKIDRQGYILFDRHPQFTAPWLPDMGDGDILITGDFDFATWDILTEYDRYELNDVKPVTIRGSENYQTARMFKVQQNAMLDRVPNGHVYYNVPVVFDYNSVVTPWPPLGVDPDDITGKKNNYTSVQRSLKLIGLDPLPTTFKTQGLRLNALGTGTSRTQGLRLTGTSFNSTTITIT